MYMEHLNLHHLRCFLAVAEAGGVTAAAEAMGLAQPTISKQVRELERAVGQSLLEREGRGVRLTQAGRLVQRYAQDIFSLESELVAAVSGRGAERLSRLVVGVSTSTPRTIATLALAPVAMLPGAVRIVGVQDRTDALLERLASGELDVVLSDAPLAPSLRFRAINEELGSSPVSWWAASGLRLRADGARALDGAPLLVPSEAAPIRGAIDQWLRRAGVRGRIAGEFEDSALLSEFGLAGHGVFAAPRLVAGALASSGARQVCAMEGVLERFFAITTDRRIRHPAVALVIDTARDRLAAASGGG